MSFRIVGDNCCDFTAEDLDKEYVISVPSAKQGKLMFVMPENKTRTGFVCPSPKEYMAAFEGGDEIYVVTLPHSMSGSYMSADIAKDVYRGRHKDVKIHVFDPKSKAAGEYAVYKKIEELALRGISFETIVELVEDYIKNMKGH